MKKIFSALTLAVVSILMFSCAVDKEIDNLASGANENAQLVLRLRAPSGYSVTTRSLSVEQENTIEDVYVLVFDKSDELVSIKKGSNVNSSVVNNNSSYSGDCSFTVTLKPSSDNSDTYNLVVLANAKSIIEDRIGFTVSEVEEKEYSDVINSIYGEIIDDPMFSGEGDYTIPMSCETGQMVIKSDTYLPLELTRSVARIDVGVGTAMKDGDGVWSWDGKDASDETVPFQLKHVYVVNPNDCYAVAPDALNTAAGMPTIPGDTEVFTGNDSKNYFEFTATEGTGSTGDYISQDIYVPEADIIMDESGTSDENKHISRMAIVVGGCYNGGTETFYRLDFVVGGSLMNVLRNHLYRFSISEVLGDGYSDVAAAYAAQSKNMIANIHEWSETGMGNIAFDGQNYLSISQSEFNFTREAITSKGENNVLSIKTDVTEGWSIEKIVDASGNAVTWVSVKTSDTEILPDGTMTSEATEAFLTVEKNETAARSATIWFTVGRMHCPVTVNQSLDPTLGSIQITDNAGNPVTTELLFVNGTSIPSQTLTVKWEPKDAILTTKSTLVGTNASAGVGTGTDTGISVTPNGTVGNGTGEYNVEATPFTDAEIADNPFLEKVSRIDFTVTNGTSTASSSIFLRQIHYNLLTDAKAYPLDGSEQTIYVRANFDWMITRVEKGGNGILDLNNVIELLNGSKGKGTHNTTTGTPLTIKMAADATSPHFDTVMISFSNTAGNLTRDVTITAIDDALYVGMFGGELKNTSSNVWKFTKPLYLQKEDASPDPDFGTEWQSENVASGVITNYTNGRQNTWNLKDATFPAANLCYQKSGSPTSADGLTWYLPAQKQLMAAWVANESFRTESFSAYYWSATEHNDSYSWAVNVITGATVTDIDTSGKTTNSYRVRCVREN